MDVVEVKPERGQLAAMLFTWAFLFVVGCMGFLIPVLLIPDPEGKLIFGILLSVYFTIMVLTRIYIPLFFKSLIYRIDRTAMKGEGGVFWKRSTVVPYAKVTNVDVSSGPLQRMFGVGTVHVQTAGAGGAQGARAELRLIGVRDRDRIRDIILQNLQERHGDTVSAEHPVSLSGNGGLLQNILAELRGIRNLLEQGR